MMWARVDEDIKKTVKRLADYQGISISEYVRQLIITDLDRRSVFTSKLKEKIRNDSDVYHTFKT